MVGWLRSSLRLFGIEMLGARSVLIEEEDEEKVDPVVVLLDRVRLGEDELEDAELGGEIKIGDAYLVLEVSSVGIWVRSRLRPWEFGKGDGNGDQQGNVHSSTILADAFSWLETRKLSSGL